MNETINGKVLGITDRAGYFWASLDIIHNPFAIVDILVVAILFYWVYSWLRGTRAVRILYGILFLLILSFLGRILHLSSLNFLLRHFMTGIIVAIPVVFQPELRSALERLGRTHFAPEFSRLREGEIERVIVKISKAIEILSKNRHGALIAISRLTGLREYVENGVKVDAEVSTELLLNIFYPKTPLHDGAVIIKGNRVLAASVMLPLSEGEFNYKMGTRHRAAVGLSSQTDAVILVVSEENGQVSLAYNGILTRNLEPSKIDALIRSLINPRPVRR